jgi:DNA (cytosine-5)-methyltransferase 1
MCRYNRKGGKRNMPKYKSIDLFAGIGGIRLGFDNAFGKDIETVFVLKRNNKQQLMWCACFGEFLHINFLHWWIS